MLHTRQQHIFYSCIRSYQHWLQSWIHQSADYVSAGIIIIGNEILNARVKDTNSHYACSLLHDCGVKVEKISIISDNVKEIKQEMKSFSEKYTYVITAGGIGPTHDDVTYEGLAKTFDDSLHYHPQLANIIKNQFGIENSKSPIYKMAYVPTKSSLIFGKENSLRYPCVTLGNVYVFPGTPKFFKKSFGNLCKELFSTNRYFAKEEIYLNTMEETYANNLTIVAQEFPNVSFGSYPVSDNSYYKAFITIESDNMEETKKAKQKLCDLIGTDALVEYDYNPHIDSLMKYQNFLSKCKRQFIYKETLEKFINLYHWPEKVAVYFDGSIESFIILHYAHLASMQLCSNNKLQIIHLKSSINFQENEELISDIMERYNVKAFTLEVDKPYASKELRLTESQLQTLLVGAEKIKFNEVLLRLPRSNEVIEQFRIIYPLDKWTKEDRLLFAKFLSLSFR